MMKNLALLVAALLCGCTVPQKLFRVDMSGVEYPETQIELNDIASVQYVLLRGTDELSNDKSLEMEYDESHTISVTSSNIMILRQGIGLHKIGQQRFLENAVYGFNRRGDFLGKNQSDTSRNYIYSYLGVSNSGRIYVRNADVGFYYTLNRKDMSTKRARYSRQELGNENLFFLNGRTVASFASNNCYIAELGKKKSRKQTLYANDDYGYFFINTSYPRPAVHYLRIPIHPYATKTRGGYMLPSPFTDTVKFIDRRGSLKDYIINTNPRVSSADKILTIEECKECRGYASFLTIDPGMVHRDCMYGDSVLRVMWPTIETTDYIFFTQASKRESILNLPARYFVYKKQEDQMYELKYDKTPLGEIPLVYGHCIFKQRNLTTSSNIAVEYIPYKYLQDNESLLPEDLKRLFGQLTDKDSGILMIIKYK